MHDIAARGNVGERDLVVGIDVPRSSPCSDGRPAFRLNLNEVAFRANLAAEVDLTRRWADLVIASSTFSAGVLIG